MGHRASAFVARLSDRVDCTVAYRLNRRTTAAFQMLWHLIRERPQLVYVLDMAMAPVLAAAAYKLVTRRRVVVDTGDAIVELARNAALRGRFGIVLTQMLERLALRIADHIVVRGTFHKELLDAKSVSSTCIVDGVDMSLFFPRDTTSQRQRLGIGSQLVVGLVGSTVWNPINQSCYGWELLEAIGLLRDHPIVGVIVGDGTGLSHLKQRTQQLDIENKIKFLGRVDMAELPDVLNAFDVGISTQSNDIAGNVRTTGKLPLYLAMDLFVIASRVGQAKLVLPDKMLIDLGGGNNNDYPSKLADRLLWLLKERDEHDVRGESRTIARHHFDYDPLAELVFDLIKEVCKA